MIPTVTGPAAVAGALSNQLRRRGDVSSTLERLEVVWAPADDLASITQIGAAHRIDAQVWLPVILAADCVRIGPIVDPSATPCIRCHYARLGGPEHQPRESTHSFLRHARTAEDAGVSAAHLALCAAVVRQLAAAYPGLPRARLCPAAGAVLRLADTSLAARYVFGIHGCADCGEGVGYRRDSMRFAEMSLSSVGRS